MSERPVTQSVSKQANDGLIYREIEGEFVLYDPHADTVHTLNATARFIWEHIQMKPKQIANALQDTYHVSAEVAQQDVQHVLEEFETLGLLQPNPPQ